MSATSPTRITLLMDLIGEGSVSMDRYGRELAEAINTYVPEFEANTFRPPVCTTQPRTPQAKMARYFWRYLYYPVIAKRLDADLFHIVDHAYGQLAYAVDGSRTVATCHDLLTLRVAEGSVPSSKPSPIRLFAFKRSTAGLRRCRFVITNSETTKRDVVRYLRVGEHKVRAIDLGLNAAFRVPSTAERCMARQELQIATNAVALLSVGTGGEHKNVEATIRVMARLAENPRLAVRLMRVGKPLAPRQLALAAELGVADNVMQTGYLPEPSLVRAYWAADVVLVPSYWEGFGWPVLEAMACGAPVVASNAPALVESSGGRAPLFEPDDTTGMAGAIERLLENPDDRRQLVESGREWARHFTWQRAAKATAEVYREVLA